MIKSNCLPGLIIVDVAFSKRSNVHLPGSFLPIQLTSCLSFSRSAFVPSFLLRRLSCHRFVLFLRVPFFSLCFPLRYILADTPNKSPAWSRDCPLGMFRYYFLIMRKVAIHALSFFCLNFQQWFDVRRHYCFPLLRQMSPVQVFTDYIDSGDRLDILQSSFLVRCHTGFVTITSIQDSSSCKVQIRSSCPFIAMSSFSWPYSFIYHRDVYDFVIIVFHTFSTFSIGL